MLDALARIMERTTAPDQRQVLLDQAAMIIQASEESVPDEPDRADVRRQYQAFLAVHAQLTGRPLATPGPNRRPGAPRRGVPRGAGF
jgi:uncharacterized membrane protein